MAPKPYLGRAELPGCCRSCSRLGARPSVTSCSRLLGAAGLSSAAPLPPALTSPASPGRVTSGEGRARGWLRTRLLLPPPAPPGHPGMDAPCARLHRCTGGWVSPAQRRPRQAGKHPRGCLGHAVAFMSPPRALAGGAAACRCLGNRGSGQSILAAWGRRSCSAAGRRGPKSHLITLRHPPVSPSPAAALGEPDQHGSAGELRQRRARHAAEGARRRPAPAQGRPAASPGPGSAAPRLLQR